MKKKILKHPLILLLTFCTLLLPTLSQAAPVGFNVSGLYKLHSSLPFADLFKLSQGWLTSCQYDWQNQQSIDPGCTANNAYNTKESAWIELDENGWIRSLPLRREPPIFTSAVSSIKLPHDFPRENYVATYTGEGILSIEGGVAITQQQAGRIEFRITNPAKGLKVHLKKTNPRNYIRDIRVFAAKNENSYQSRPYRVDYLQRVQPFSAIRFMPWQNAKDSKLARWSDRPTPNHAHYNGVNGVPIETMVDLANLSDSDAWFTVPYLADRNYIENFANVVKKRLSSRRKVYIEYSNEVWNALYPVHHLAVKESIRRWPSKYHDKGALRKQLLVANWYAEKSVESCNIWKRAFGGQSNRVVCVMASFARTPDVGREALSCPLISNTPCAKQVDAYAVAPYFGDYVALINHRPEVTQWANSGNGLGLLFQELINGGVLSNGPKGGAVQLAYDNGIRGSAAVAKEFGVQLLAYEAGQHLKRDDRPHTLRDPAILNMFLQANQDQRMGGLYRQYLKRWRSEGGGLLMHFYGIAESEPFTAFGMLETSNSSNTPKYNALLDYLNAP